MLRAGRLGACQVQRIAGAQCAGGIQRQLGRAITTVRTLSFDPAGRVLQQVSSVGGGENWHYGGGKKTEFAGHWVARDGVVHVQAEGGGEFVPAGRYRFADAYLITENAQGRLVWRRR